MFVAVGLHEEINDFCSYHVSALLWCLIIHSSHLLPHILLHQDCYPFKQLVRKIRHVHYWIGSFSFWKYQNRKMSPLGHWCLCLHFPPCLFVLLDGTYVWDFHISHEEINVSLENVCVAKSFPDVACSPDSAKLINCFFLIDWPIKSLYDVCAKCLCLVQ